MNGISRKGSSRYVLGGGGGGGLGRRNEFVLEPDKKQFTPGKG